MKPILPINSQTPLPQDQLIVDFNPSNDEAVPMNVVFVGGGPAGLSGAIELSRLIKKDNEAGGTLGDIEVAVLEKAENLGGHSLSGAVLNPRALIELFPELEIKDFPLRTKVEGDAVYYMTENGQWKLPTPPTMHNDGNYVASICEVVRWLGEKAEELGVNIFNNFPADSLLKEGKAIKGVRTTPMGLNKDGSPSSQFMPATDITADLTVLTEGTRGPLSQSYFQWQNIASNRPQIYALGVKELWKTKKQPKKVIHTLGYPLPKDCFGGSWMYPMGDGLVSLGLVAGLDYKDHNLDVHVLLQKLKTHPLFTEYLEGGEIVEWGAKTIPEGGLESIPHRLHGDGILFAGDCVGLVNVPALKGIHYAMHSGILAARTAFEALKAKDFSSEKLKSYDENLKSSYIISDLKKVKNMRHAFKSGFYSGGLKAGLMTLTGGSFPGVSGPHLEDAAEEKTTTTPPEKNIGMSKVDAVYLSGNKTRDDIPQHLTVGKDISEKMAEHYSHLCPAGVYEVVEGKLIVNAPNCVDCKATDVLGPRWRPREGGSGPNYNLM